MAARIWPVFPEVDYDWMPVSLEAPKVVSMTLLNLSEPPLACAGAGPHASLGPS